MDRSARTHNPYTPYDWMTAAAPSRCEVCGRTLAPAAPDWTTQANQWYTSTYAPMMDNWTRMWNTMAQPWAGMAQAWMPPGTSPAWPGMQMQPAPHPHHQHHHHHGHQHDCGCEQGECDGCHGDHHHCRCCIADADLVVYARLGERRVVPLTIENPRRRERAVKLELSAFTRSGRAAENIKAQITGEAEFTVPPCQEHEAVLLIEAVAPANDSGQTNEPGSTVITGRGGPDVEACEVFYADLRVEGCDMRPLRIALALLPRDCAGYKVDCDCSCC